MTAARGFLCLSRDFVSRGDLDPVIFAALRNHRCAECGAELDYRKRPKSVFCSDTHSRRYRDRKAYAANVEAARERSRDYYARNRIAVLARAKARREAARSVPLPIACSQCGKALEGKQRVTCGSSRCREQRFRRLHPEAYAAREARKVERRRDKRREAAGS
jgi:hypothetical protein